MLMNVNEENITIRELGANEVVFIYTHHSVRHFPEDELKPVASVERMLAEGIYKGYGIYESDNGKRDDGSLLCYALFTVLPERRNVLLDYFAVMEEYRNLGIGSLFLKHFRSSVTCYDGVLIEVENPDYAEGKDDLEIRNRRIGFYERNGAFQTGISAKIFDARYRLLFSSCSDDT